MKKVQKAILIFEDDSKAEIVFRGKEKFNVSLSSGKTATMKRKYKEPEGKIGYEGKLSDEEKDELSEIERLIG